MIPYTIIIEKTPGSNYGAYSPDVGGCITVGDTIDETLEMMKEALEFHFEGLLDAGLAIPPPQGLLYHLAHATEEDPLFYDTTDIVAFIDPEMLHWTDPREAALENETHSPIEALT
jgi:predicted RNase H-like HicB family nuclease